MLRLVAVLVFLLSAAALALVNRVASRPRSQLFTAVDDPASDPARPPTAANPPQSSLRSLKKERICEDPVVEAWYTADGQNLLETKFCPDGQTMGRFRDD